MPADSTKLVRVVDLLARRGDLEEMRKQKRQLNRSESRLLPSVGAWGGEGPGRAEALAARRQKAATARSDKAPLPELSALATAMFSLPQRAPRKSRGTLISFLVVVALPVVLAGIYYFGIASSQYMAEFRFAVRNAQASISGGSADGSSILGAVTGNAGSNSLENYMVVEYLTSDPAVEDIQRRIDIRKLYSSEGVDRFSRLDPDASLEGLVRYWKGMVRAAYDQVTGISTVQVRTFRAEDAQLIAQTLTAMSEELITRIAHRPQQDAVRFAEQDLQKAEDRLKRASVEMTQFRNTERMIEPTSNVVLSNTQLAATLRSNLSQLQMTFSSLVKQNLSPTSPARVSLEARIKATREQLAAIENEVSEPTGTAKPISGIVGQYEQLDLERTFAQDVVKSALRNMETARSNALLQHMYVVPFVEPVLPNSPLYPNRLMSTLFAAMICLLIWAVGLLLFRSVREHIA